jgi:hypothetical protein
MAEITKGSRLQPGTLRERLQKHSRLRLLLSDATAADSDTAILARGGRGGASGKSKGGQNNGDKGDSAAKHGDLEGIKL